MDRVQTRDEPAGQVQARLAQLGVLADLGRLAGWQRSLIYDACEVAHRRDLTDHDTLAGARYLQELADTYARSRPGQSDLLVVDILQRAATSYVQL